eukprot:CAMPEP_0182433442 /NCGR_PEP_ID=MMETSP1167-20130531/63264_1 /TAXON_ID=2988 /ORGANISM="Mallomonas Sp, Strain CCMP3275" /LENGTH=223 /DNA_ID=CAMNT_0024622143 /DNA_START=118 /DNA_END=789 /DNA_ORIENTATION=-
MLLNSLSKSSSLLVTSPFQLSKPKKFFQKKDGCITFGAKIPLTIKLPSSNQLLIDEFISDSINILRSTWDSDKYFKIGNENEYLLRFRPIPLIGLDTIIPEIKVDMIPDSVKKSSSLKTKSWNLKGNSKILKDSDFVKSFDIDIEGYISTMNAPEYSAQGVVEYTVKGKTPFMFQIAPSFILEKVIDAIQDRVLDFALVQFSSKFVKGFRSYARAQSSTVTSG